MCICLWRVLDCSWCLMQFGSSLVLIFTLQLWYIRVEQKLFSGPNPCNVSAINLLGSLLWQIWCALWHLWQCQLHNTLSLASSPRGPFLSFLSFLSSASPFLYLFPGILQNPKVAGSTQAEARGGERSWVGTSKQPSALKMLNAGAGSKHHGSGYKEWERGIKHPVPSADQDVRIFHNHNKEGAMGPSYSWLFLIPVSSTEGHSSDGMSTS